MVVNPVGSAKGTTRVVRGGNWKYPARYCRSAQHYGCSPGSDNRLDNLGFRLVLLQGPTSTPVASSPVKITHPRRSEPRTVSRDVFKVVFKLDKKRRPKKYVPITSNRFQKIKNGQVIIDRATGLMWQQAGSSESMRYKAAQQYVKRLNSDNFTGYNDWRLPTADELTSLITQTKQNGGLYISSVFDNKQRWCWSSDRGSSGLAWVVYFYYGGVNLNGLSSNFYVRVVRAGQYVPIKEGKKSVEKHEPTPAPVASSPVKITHPRRSEPKMVSRHVYKSVFKLDKKSRPKQYVPITSNRFQKIKTGQIIKDRATGLMWQQGGSSSMKYKEAQKYVKKLNSKNFGYNDWRLPTVDELTSLLTKTTQTGGLYISSVFDKNQRYCWSSDRGSSVLAWVVNFNGGDVYHDFLFNNYYVRVVRAGQ